MPMFPLSTVLFPYAPLALHVFEERYRAMVADCLAGDGSFGVVLIARGAEVGGGDERVDVGTLARIELAQPLADGRWALVARGTTRLKVATWEADDPYPRAVVDDLSDPPPGPDHAGLGAAHAALTRARALLSELGEDTGGADLFPADLFSSGPAPSSGPAADEEADTGAGTGTADDADDRSVALWRLCAEAPVPVSDRQRLLEADGHAARLELLVRLCQELADDVARFLGGHRHPPTGQGGAGELPPVGP